MNWIKVDSSRANKVAFVKERNQAFIEFKNGDIYQYNEVSENIFDKFIKSPSIGKAILILGQNYIKLGE